MTTCTQQARNACEILPLKCDAPLIDTGMALGNRSIARIAKCPGCGEKTAAPAIAVRI